jgi:ketosteroid isomerase-like protein
MSNHANTDADRLAIEALNQHDVTATLACDLGAIFSQWTDDFVVIPGTGDIVRGRSVNAANAERAMEQMQGIVPVDYHLNAEEITVSGDYAFEWGTYHGTARPSGGGSDITYSGKFMRILQRQSDGSWKMHRTMATTDAPART